MSCLSSGGSQSFYLIGDNADCSKYRGISLLSVTYKSLSSIVVLKLTVYAEEILGIVSVDLNVTGQLMIICSAFVKYIRKKWENNEKVHQLFIDFKNGYDSVRREVLYPYGNNKSNKMHLNKTFSRVRLGKNLCDMFLLRMV
jgi:hypothetical protein